MNDSRPDREKRFRTLLYAGDIIRKLSTYLEPASLALFAIGSLAFILLFVYYIGFSHLPDELVKLKNSFTYLLILLFVTRFVLGFYSFDRKKLLSFGIRTLVMIFSLGVILCNTGIIKEGSGISLIFRGTGPVVAAGFFLVAMEIYRLFELISSFNFPPALVFSSSFLVLILTGAGLLMLPNARQAPVSVIDTLFTSASAVCVTGLTVVETASSFTLLGKMIILLLIQLGGLGMMTFTGFFSYVFTSRSTLQERMLLQDIFSAESLGNLFKILVKIVLFTFLSEGLGAAIIYFSLPDGMADKSFYAVFHSVSAFCNAGFSTLPDNLMAAPVSGNYVLLTTITFLIIAGGLGFPVMLRLYAVVKNKVIVFYDRITDRKLFYNIERLDPSSKIALATSLILIAAGTAALYILENRQSMSAMGTGDKLFLSYFNSVTARTAGFNMSDLSRLGYPAVFILIGLMWIGASPGSTGGGIKTSSFAVALRMAWSNIRGRKNLEIAGREINPGTINRVLSIIILSLVVISSGFMGLLITNPGRNPVHLLFETVSAFSTVGLSITGTQNLSEAGKIILILVMFTGRVGPLTLLTGLFISTVRKHHAYPSGDILIN